MSLTAQEKYDKIFIDSFGVSAENLSALTYQSIPAWDSVGHMGMIAELEETFDIIIDMDDIIDFSSYEIGKSILRKYGVEI